MAAAAASLLVSVPSYVNNKEGANSSSADDVTETMHDWEKLSCIVMEFLSGSTSAVSNVAWVELTTIVYKLCTDIKNPQADILYFSLARLIENYTMDVGSKLSGLPRTLLLERFNETPESIYIILLLI